MKKHLLFGALLAGSLFSASAQIFTGTFTGSADVAGWGVIDADQDTKNWGLFAGNETTTGWGLEGNFAGSRSFDPTLGPLTPDNYIVTPVITLNESTNYILTFLTGASFFDANSGPGEQMSVYITTQAAPTLAQLQELTAVYNEVFDDQNGVEQAFSRTVNLTPYAGQSIRIAFRHHDCSDQSILFLDNVEVSEGVMGVSENINASNFSLFPNPAVDIINVSVDNALVQGAKIVDLNGRIVKSVKFDKVTSAQINVADLSSGVYMMTISSDKGTTTKKFVKN